MGMSTSVIFLREKTDKEHQKKVDVLRACLAANISLPPEIDEYFGGGTDENYPLQIEIKSAVSEWFGDDCGGIDVTMDKLPEEIKTIRFCNSR